MTGVVDSSVVLKWYVREHDSALATPLLGLRLVAPDLILAELANAFWKKVRGGEMGGAGARDALAHLPEAVTLVPSPALIDPAFSLAVDMLHPVYDCVFLALSGDLHLPLITADGKFYRRARAAGHKNVVLLEDWKNG